MDRSSRDNRLSFDHLDWRFDSLHLSNHHGESAELATNAETSAQRHGREGASSFYNTQPSAPSVGEPDADAEENQGHALRPLSAPPIGTNEVDFPAAEQGVESLLLSAFDNDGATTTTARPFVTEASHAQRPSLHDVLPAPPQLHQDDVTNVPPYQQSNNAASMVGGGPHISLFGAKPATTASSSSLKDLADMERRREDAAMRPSSNDLFLGPADRLAQPPPSPMTTTPAPTVPRSSALLGAIGERQTASRSASLLELSGAAVGFHGGSSVAGDGNAASADADAGARHHAMVSGNGSSAPFSPWGQPDTLPSPRRPFPAAGTIGDPAADLGGHPAASRLQPPTAAGAMSASASPRKNLRALPSLPLPLGSFDVASEEPSSVPVATDSDSQRIWGNPSTSPTLLRHTPRSSTASLPAMQFPVASSPRRNLNPSVASALDVAAAAASPTPPTPPPPPNAAAAAPPSAPAPTSRARKSTPAPPRARSPFPMAYQKPPSPSLSAERGVAAHPPVNSYAAGPIGGNVEAEYPATAQAGGANLPLPMPSPYAPQYPVDLALGLSAPGTSPAPVPNFAAMSDAAAAAAAAAAASGVDLKNMSMHMGALMNVQQQLYAVQLSQMGAAAADRTMERGAAGLAEGRPAFAAPSPPFGVTPNSLPWAGGAPAELSELDLEAMGRMAAAAAHAPLLPSGVPGRIVSPMPLRRHNHGNTPGCVDEGGGFGGAAEHVRRGPGGGGELYGSPRTLRGGVGRRTPRGKRGGGGGAGGGHGGGDESARVEDYLLSQSDRKNGIVGDTSQPSRSPLLEKFWINFMSAGGRASPLSSTMSVISSGSGELSDGGGGSGGEQLGGGMRAGAGKDWQLADIRGNVVAFATDQHGSRFIQQKLATARPADVQMVLDEALQDIQRLMADVFGNYVVQKLLEYGGASGAYQIGAQVRGRLLSLSLHMYGCRVVQTALRVLDRDTRAELVRELDGHVLQCIHDQNGNHVIQKCIELIEPEHVQFIVAAVIGQLVELAEHSYGCRVVQRILEHGSPAQKAPIMHEIMRTARELINDQYGNYVIQHVVEQGSLVERRVIVDMVRPDIFALSQHKFASNVVERCLQFSTTEQRREMIELFIMGDNPPPASCAPPNARSAPLLPPPTNSPLSYLVRDQYGNYVVQRVLDVAEPWQRERVVEVLRDEVAVIKKYSYGKHIIARLDPGWTTRNVGGSAGGGGPHRGTGSPGGYAAAAASAIASDAGGGKSHNTPSVSS